MSNPYKTERNYENLQKRIFDGVGLYRIPALEPVQLETIPDFIGFNYVRGCDEPEGHGVHFFIDDYQFIRLWSNPDRYTDRLRQFDCVCTPDFSTYTDFPMVIQLYNHYRKHWLGAYWWEQGIKVIPTIGWSDRKSFRWCFDGEPVGGTVAISSVGTQKNRAAMELFRLGYAEMQKRLKPSKVLFWGCVPEGLEADNIIQIKSFQQKWREKDIE